MSVAARPCQNDGPVVIVNVALVAPAATLTVGGTVAMSGRPFVRLTSAPPDGAGPLKISVPRDEPPAVTRVGLIENVDSQTDALPEFVSFTMKASSLPALV